MSEIQSRESKARRALQKAGYQLQKTPSRSHLRDWYGAGYMIVDSYHNTVVSGATHRAYSDTLDDVEAFISDQM